MKQFAADSGLFLNIGMVEIPSRGYDMKSLMLTVTWLALFLLPLADAETIDWQHWELEAFSEAKENNKIILISVGMEGCAACARMESITYTDRAVIHLINQHFVAIEVDAEARPDIGERYSDWAWPATIFLAPDATQVLAIRGNRSQRRTEPYRDSYHTLTMK